MERYAKQINFSRIGLEGQQNLKQSKALIIGCGALGTVVANSLVRAGVGTLRIVDRDFVELSNLHRQILFDEEDANNSIPKVEAAKEKLKRVNGEVQIEGILKDVNSITIQQMVEGMEIILDCTDNFKTRFLINDISFKNKIPWIYGAAIGSTGVVKNYLPGEGSCLRCMLPEPPPTGSIATCDTAGVVNTVTGIVGMLQSNEAIKYLSHNKDLMLKQMIYFDLWENEFEKMELTTNEDCSCCQRGIYEFLDNKKPEAVHICGNNSVQVDPQSSEGKVNLKKLYERLLAAGISVKLTPFLLNIQVDAYELKVFDDGRAIIKNVKSVEEAKTLYSKYIGY